MSWHWIFLINIPVGVFGIVCARFYMPNLTGKASRFDIIGFVLFSDGIVLATLGLDFVGEAARDKALACYFVVIGFLLVGSYVFYAKGKNGCYFRFQSLEIPLFR